MFRQVRHSIRVSNRAEVGAPVLWVVLASVFLICHVTAGQAQTLEADLDVYSASRSGYLKVADSVGLVFGHGSLVAGEALLAHVRDVGTSPGFGITYEYALFRHKSLRVKPTVAASTVAFDGHGGLVKKFDSAGMLSAGARILVLRAPEKSLSLRTLAFSGRQFARDGFTGLTTKGVMVGVGFHTLSRNP
jgi:hypothetical protein